MADAKYWPCWKSEFAVLVRKGLRRSGRPAGDAVSEESVVSGVHCGAALREPALMQRVFCRIQASRA